MAIYITEEEIVAAVEKQIGSGSQKEWAKNAGISPAYLSDFLLRRRRAGPAILRAAGFSVTPYYRKEKSNGGL
jgi:hypothetical protein